MTKKEHAAFQKSISTHLKSLKKMVANVMSVDDLDGLWAAVVSAAGDYLDANAALNDAEAAFATALAALATARANNQDLGAPSDAVLDANVTRNEAIAALATARSAYEEAVTNLVNALLGL